MVSGLGTQTARIARLQGMVAGTPFYLALIPGYMNYLWQEARMNLRLAALYGRDPGIFQTAAELLSLRGVYPTTQEAEAGLLVGRGRGHPAQAGAPQAAAIVDRVGAADARVRRVHRPCRAESRITDGGAGARRRRGRHVPRPVGDHLGLPGDVHDHDGLGLRNPLAGSCSSASLAFYAAEPARATPARTRTRVASARSEGEAGGQRRGTCAVDRDPGRLPCLRDPRAQEVRHHLGHRRLACSSPFPS